MIIWPWPAPRSRSIAARAAKTDGIIGDIIARETMPNEAGMMSSK